MASPLASLAAGSVALSVLSSLVLALPWAETGATLGAGTKVSEGPLLEFMPQAPPRPSSP